MWTQTPPTPPSSRNGQDQVVVAGVERKPELDDPSRLLEIVVCLLHGLHVRDLGELGKRLGLEVEDHAARNVVDDDRLVGHRGDRLEVLHDASGGRLRVVGRHDEERIDAQIVRPLRQVDGVGGRVGAGAGDDGGAVADLVEGGGVELEALVVDERR